MEAFTSQALAVLCIASYLPCLCRNLLPPGANRIPESDEDDHVETAKDLPVIRKISTKKQLKSKVRIFTMVP